MLPWIIAIMVYMISIVAGIILVMAQTTFKNTEAVIDSQPLLIAGLLIATLIYTAALLMIIFSTYTHVVLNEWLINLLQLIGATDGFIIKQFRNHALRTSIKGGCIGSIMAALTWAFILYGNVTNTIISGSDIMMTIIVTPCFICLLTLISSQLTVSFVLARRS